MRACEQDFINDEFIEEQDQSFYYNFQNQTKNPNDTLNEVLAELNELASTLEPTNYCYKSSDDDNDDQKVDDLRGLRRKLKNLKIPF